MKPCMYPFFVTVCNIFMLAGFVSETQANLLTGYDSLDSAERHCCLDASAKVTNKPILPLLSTHEKEYLSPVNTSGDTIGPGRIVINSWDFSRPTSPLKKHLNKKLSADSSKKTHKAAPLSDPEGKNGATG